jgi:single-stranded DNA-binding protein
MARDLNKVMLTGHLGADPEMRFTPTGQRSNDIPCCIQSFLEIRRWRSAR